MLRLSHSFLFLNVPAGAAQSRLLIIKPLCLRSAICSGELSAIPRLIFALLCNDASTLAKSCAPWLLTLPSVAIIFKLTLAVA